MRNKLLILCMMLGFSYSCQKEEAPSTPQQLTFEKINYYAFPKGSDAVPFQYRLTYYYDNGLPHRWLETDSLGRVMTDYIYEYDANWLHVGARYREEGESEFSIERVHYSNDSTKVTEWPSIIEFSCTSNRRPIPPKLTSAL